MDDELEALCKEFDDMEEGMTEDLFGTNTEENLESKDMLQADVPKPNLAETMAVETKCEQAKSEVTKCEETKFELGPAKLEHQKEQDELQGMEVPRKRRRLPDTWFEARGEKPPGASVPETHAPSTPVRPHSKQKSEREPLSQNTPTAKRSRNTLGTPPSAQASQKQAASSSRNAKKKRGESLIEAGGTEKKVLRASQEQHNIKFCCRLFAICIHTHVFHCFPTVYCVPLDY